MKTVLLTAVGSASAHAAHQSLKAAGYRVLGCDIYPETWNVNAGEMDAFFTVPLASDADAYAAALLAAVCEYGVDCVIPLTDVEVDALCGRKAAFRKAGATVCCPDETVAGLCRDKLRMAQRIDAAGLCRVIPTYRPEALPDVPPYPLMLKPIRGRSSQAQLIARGPEELSQALSLRDDYIVQPYLSGDVYTVDCARDSAGNAVTVTRHELLRTVNGLGTAVEICPGHALDAVCRGIAAETGIIGVVNMEFIDHAGEYYFLEVNPRFSGGVGFSALAGYDMVRAMVEIHAGLPLPPAPVFHRMTLAQRYEMRVTSDILTD